MQKPDFLVIGAARAGTTWLYENLRKINGIWLPPDKEIHYFDRNVKYPSPSFLHDNSFTKRITGKEPYNRDFRKKMIRGIGKSIIKLQFGTMLWRLRYYLGNVDDIWYGNLLKNKDNFTGDITPAYQLLTEQDVEHVHNIVPGAKIIFIIRNPIDRTWSQLRKK